MNISFARITFAVILFAVGNACGAPQATDFLPVDAIIMVRDEANAAMNNMTVMAFNREYGFRLQQDTDASGLATLEVMPGTWDFFAIPTFTGLWNRQGRAYLLAATNIVFAASSRSLTLIPTRTTSVYLQSSIFSFTARENYVGFSPRPDGCFLEAKSCGVVSSGTNLTLYTTAGLSVRPFVASPRSSGPYLYFISDETVPGTSLGIKVTAANSGLLAFNARNALNNPTAYHVQLHAYDLSWQWSPAIYDLASGIPGIRVSTNNFYMIQAVDDDTTAKKHRLALNPRLVRVTGGATNTYAMGGALTNGPVRTTPRAAADFTPATQLMVPIYDAASNCVRAVDKWDTGQLTPNITVTYNNQTSAVFEAHDFFCAKLPVEFARASSPQYRVTWNFGPWGTGALTGPLYGQEERRMDMDDTSLLLGQAPRLIRATRTVQMVAYQQLEESLVTLLGVPSDYKKGIISNILHAGFEDEVQHGYKLEIGIELNRLPDWPPGDTFLDHEAGHGILHKPPARFFAFDVYAEAYATLIGCKARSLLFGGDEYLKYLLGAHDTFLRHQHGAAVTTAGERIESMQFVTQYIHTHYGWTPHRRMILEWGNTFLGMRAALAAAGYTDMEQFACVSSWLTGDNLGPLFVAAGFAATEARIATGLGVLNGYLSGLTTGVKVGVNTIETPDTSVPIEIVATGLSVTSIAFSVYYVSNQVSRFDICRRDLSAGTNWALTLTTNGPGQVLVSMKGTPPVSNLGSVANCRMRLAPGASGTLPIGLSNVLFNGASATGTGSALTIPASTCIGPLPPWPGTPLWAIGGTPPYTWSVEEDALPPGLRLDANTGQITGFTTTNAAEYLFRLRADDSAAHSAHRWFSMTTFDSDADHVPDWWEWQHYGSETGCVALADDDGDGMCNRDEYLTETDPWDRTSILSLLAIRPSGDTCTVTWASVPSVPYCLARSTNMLDVAGFAVIKEMITANHFTTTFADTNPPTSLPCFYRIEVHR